MAMVSLIPMDWRELYRQIGSTSTDWPMTFRLLPPETPRTTQFVLTKKDPSRRARKGAERRTGAYDQRARCLAYKRGIYIPAENRTLPSKRLPLTLWPAGPKRVSGTIAIKTHNAGETRVQLRLDDNILTTLSPSSSVANPDVAQGGYIDNYTINGELDLSAGGLFTAHLWAGHIYYPPTLDHPPDGHEPDATVGLLMIEPVDS